MGIRGELFSTRLILPNRTYFLNVKENRLGDLYLNIVESKNKETGGFERQSVIVFADELPAFLGEFDKSLKALERAMRDQKKESRERKERRTGEDEDREKSVSRFRKAERGERKPERGGRKTERSEGRRVVVKKRPE